MFLFIWIYDALKQEVRIDPVHKLLSMHVLPCQDCLASGRSTGNYFLSSQGRVWDFSTFIASPVSISSAKTERNAGVSVYIAMSYIPMLQNNLNYEDTGLLWTLSLQCSVTIVVQLQF